MRLEHLKIIIRFSIIWSFWIYSHCRNSSRSHTDLCKNAEWYNFRTQNVVQESILELEFQRKKVLSNAPNFVDLGLRMNIKHLETILRYRYYIFWSFWIFSNNRNPSRMPREEKTQSGTTSQAKMKGKKAFFG